MSWSRNFGSCELSAHEHTYMWHSSRSLTAEFGAYSLGTKLGSFLGNREDPEAGKSLRGSCKKVWFIAFTVHQKISFSPQVNRGGGVSIS